MDAAERELSLLLLLPYATLIPEFILEYGFVHSRRIVRALGSGLASGHVAKGGSVFRTCRMLSTSVLTHESRGVAFCSESLSLNPGGGAECTTVTKFCHEKNGSTTLISDVANAPIPLASSSCNVAVSKKERQQILVKTLIGKDNGRTSHGTLSDPQLSVFKARSHTFKNFERLGLKIALTSRAAQGKLLVFEDFGIYRNKPKNIVNYVKQKQKKKKILLVDGGPISEKLKLATKKLRYVTVMPQVSWMLTASFITTHWSCPMTLFITLLRKLCILLSTMDAARHTGDAVSKIIRERYLYCQI